MPPPRGAARSPSLVRVRLRGRFLRLAAWVVFVLCRWGLGFGAALFGVPAVYYGWMQYQCWRAGPDSHECWLLDLLRHPNKPAEKQPGTRERM